MNYNKSNNMTRSLASKKTKAKPAFMLRAPVTKKAQFKSGRGKNTTVKPLWDAKQLTVGQIFSNMSYLRVDAINGNKVTV